MRRVSLSACDALPALVGLREMIAGIAPASPGSGAECCDQTAAIVPAAAHAPPHAAGSDGGSERTSRGRDNLVSWSFSFHIRASFVAVPL